jgi:outer membrane protein
MFVRTRVVLVLLTLTIALALPAGSAIASGKIGFVHVQRAIIESEDGKKAEGELKGYVEKLKQQIGEREKDVEALKADMEKGAGSLKEGERREKEDNLKRKSRDYQLFVKDVREMIDARREELLKGIYPDMLKVINEIGEKEGYSLIVDPVAQQYPYYSKKDDLTRQVVEEFNKLRSKK